ncbi:hypothetical protein Tco_0426091 [Tanacetum coccineum]
MLESEAYKTYHAYAIGEKIPKPKYVKNKADPESSPKKKSSLASKGKRLKTSAKVALSEVEQMKLATKRSKTQFHSSHASGSGADEGTGITSGVPDVPTYDFKDEQISWNDADNEDDEDQVMLINKDDDGSRQDDDEQTVKTMMGPILFFQECDEANSRVRNVDRRRTNEADRNEEEEVMLILGDMIVNLEGRDTKMNEAH